MLVNNGCYLNMNYENEVFGLARVRISEVRINELLYCLVMYISTTCASCTTSGPNLIMTVTELKIV